MKLWIAALLCVLAMSRASAQTVEAMGYFKNVVDKSEAGHRSVNPVGPYPDNHSIRLTALTVTQKQHTVYAAATMTSEVAPSKVIFIFQRSADPKDPRCAGERGQDFTAFGDLSALKKPTASQEELGVGARIYRWVADQIGGDEFGVGNVKVMVVSTEPGARTYYDYRFVSCAGKVRVWVTDPQLNLLGPSAENHGITLTINY